MENETLALLIPILAIILGVGIAMLALFLNYRKRKETFALYHQERMAALEKGVDLPAVPDFMLSDEAHAFRSYHPRRHLLKGLIWLFTGIGLGVALWPTVGWEHSLFSLIPIGVGLAHLIYYFVEGKAETTEQQPGAVATKS